MIRRLWRWLHSTSPALEAFLRAESGVQPILLPVPAVVELVMKEFMARKLISITDCTHVVHEFPRGL